MNEWLILAAALAVSIAAAHSILGERYILIRLFDRGCLPQLFGSDVFTKQTLRFAWHLTTAAWIGFAVLLIVCANQVGEPSGEMIVKAIGLVFLVSALLSLVITRGRHLSWIVFLAIAMAAWFGSSS